MPLSTDPRSHYLIRLGDNALVLGHRLSEWSSLAPTIEEDIALSNLALDLIGQARALYTHACALEGGKRDEDKLAYRRLEHEFANVLLVEQPNGNFADTMVRHLIYAAFAHPFYQALTASNDETVAGIAARSAKEMAYHLRHAAEWVVRLGDGTSESHAKAQTALDEMMPFAEELFEFDAIDRQMLECGLGADPSKVRAVFDATLDRVLNEATLTRPKPAPGHTGGRSGRHSEHLGRLLSELQYLQRAFPDATW